MPRFAYPDRYKKLIRTEILQSAEKVFARRGYYGTTIKAIAAEANIATGSLYQYFKNKDDLYGTLLEEKIRDLLNTLRQSLANNSGDRQKLKILVNSVVDFFTRNVAFFRIYAAERVLSDFKLHSKIWLRVFKYRQSFLNLFKTEVAEAMQKGEIQAADPGLVAEILLEIMHAIFRNKILSQEKPSVYDLTNLITSVFYQGVGKRTQ